MNWHYNMSISSLLKRTRARGKRDQHGFTLMELLVVLAILALLATIAVPQLFKYLDGSKDKTARIQIQSFGSSLDLYRFDVGAYPSSEQGLVVLIDRPTGDDGKWNGPYIRNRASLTDPWGNEYQYKQPGEHGEYDLSSTGPEGDSNDEPEIRNW